MPDDAEDPVEEDVGNVEPPVFFDTDESSTAQKGKTIEPVFWWSYPVKFYSSIVHGYFAKRVIQVAAGEGNCAMACLEHRPPIGYLGICFNQTHQDTPTNWAHKTRIFGILG